SMDVRERLLEVSISFARIGKTLYRTESDKACLFIQPQPAPCCGAIQWPKNRKRNRVGNGADASTRKYAAFDHLGLEPSAWSHDSWRCAPPAGALSIAHVLV